MKNMKGKGYEIERHLSDIKMIVYLIYRANLLHLMHIDSRFWI